MKRNQWGIIIIIMAISSSMECSHEYVKKRGYDLDYYLDTIEGHGILSSVCTRNDGQGIGFSSIDLGTVDQPNRLRLNR